MPDHRKPWFKFYSRDWRANAKLRLCSFAARGLWIDMLSLMHESARHGFLLIEGVVPSPKQLASLLGGAEKEIKALLAELAATNVYSVTGQPMPSDVQQFIPGDMPEGVILSRRMLRDDAKAERDKANGKGGGNPSLKAGVNPPGYRSEIRDQRLESHGSTNSAVTPSAPAPGGARSGTSEPLRLTGASSIWSIRLLGHRPGAPWPAEHGPAPESDQDNPQLDDQQRRDWRRHHGLAPDWRKARAA